MKTELTLQEQDEIVTGEAISLTAVMAVVAIAICAVIVYKVFMSKEGTTTIPGGWKFTWE